jgi:putative ABC transport system ATP-binding protein
VALLELEEVVKHYSGADESVRAVDGVTLAIEPGELFALHGPSGSGKTTLLLLIAALLRPDSGTIRFNGREIVDLSESEACDHLRRVGLGDSLARTPEQLSAGERQRVAIARALVGEPRLILADEPTGNLDSSRSLEIVRLLATVAHARQATVLLVTHDLEAACVADRRHMLRDGKLVERYPEGRAEVGVAWR